MSPFLMSSFDARFRIWKISRYTDFSGNNDKFFTLLLESLAVFRLFAHFLKILPCRKDTFGAPLKKY